MPSELHTERRGTTLVLTLSDRATRNLLSAQLFSAGVEALNVAESDPGVRCVVVHGDGEHFSAGIEAAEASLLAQALDGCSQFVEALRACPKPVVAAVEGVAAGVGFSLALACDLVVAAEDSRFSLTPAETGLTLDGGGRWHLAQRLPRALGLQFIWLPEPLSAQRLHALGLVNWVVERGQALGHACAVAERLAQLAPDALAAAKDLVDQRPRQLLSEHLARQVL